MAESAQNRRLLTAMRAAAILIVVTGLNDVIAGAVPRYEPLYLFLGAIALVVWLDGVILGAITAIGAIAFYALLFMPHTSALSTALLVPLGEAFATVLVVGIARGILRARRRAAPPEIIPRSVQSLLPPPPIAADNSEVLTAIDELRNELRTAVGDLAFSRDREALLERTANDVREALLTRVRLTEEENARLVRLADTERAERTHLEAAARSFEAMTREREALAREESEASARALAAAREEGEANALALASAQAEAETTARALKATRNAAEANARALANARDEADTNARALAEARKELDASRSENDALRGEMGRLRGAVEASHAELVSQGRDMTALNAAAEELRRTIEIERTRGDEERALRMTASERIEELERVLESERAARNSEGSSSRERVAQAEQTLADERALRERLEVDAATRDTEADTLRARIEELEQALGELAGTHGDVESGMRAKIETLEDELREATAASEAHRSETAALRAQIEELEQSLANAGTEFDEKLNTIVTHLAEDHEADLGREMEAKEEARAEVRSLTMRLSTLQRKVDEEQQAVMARVRESEERHRRSLDDSTRQLAETRAAAQHEIDRLRARVAEIEAAPKVHRANGGARPRVLIAHPDADLRMSARASLERAGYEILSAGDGLEALRTANAERPDVVIADAVMPKMDGRELCQLLKSQEKTAHIRVILLTRSTDEPHKGDLPPDGILRKPVPLEMLKSTLAALLSQPSS